MKATLPLEQPVIRLTQQEPHSSVVKAHGDPLLVTPRTCADLFRGSIEGVSGLNKYGQAVKNDGRIPSLQALIRLDRTSF